MLFGKSMPRAVFEIFFKVESVLFVCESAKPHKYIGAFAARISRLAAVVFFDALLEVGGVADVLALIYRAFEDVYEMHVFALLRQLLR